MSRKSGGIMVLGVPKEIKPSEGRVAATPALVKQLVREGVRVLVETGAGVRSGYPDRDYRNAGAVMVRSANELWRRSGVVLKVKEPIGQERRRFREDLILICYLHLAADRGLTVSLLESGMMAVGLETMVQADGFAPMLAPMSEIAGRLAVLEGAHHLATHPAGQGRLIGGAKGGEPAAVCVFGAGTAGRAAAETAAGLGARVTVLDRSEAALGKLHGADGGKIDCRLSAPAALKKAVTSADLLVASAYVPGERAPVLVSRSLVKTMKRGAVIVDISIDQGGCVETSRAGTHADPIRVVDGVLHYAVPNMPGIVPRTSTEVFSTALQPFLLDLFRNDPRMVIYEHPVWRSGLNVVEQEIIHHGVQRAYLPQ